MISLNYAGKYESIRPMSFTRRAPQHFEVSHMRSSRSIFSFLVLAAVLGVVYTGYLLFKDTTPPEIVLLPETKRVYPGEKFTVTVTDSGSHIRSVTATVRKNSQMQVLHKTVFTDKANTQTVEFALKDTSLRDGAFTLIVNAADGSFAGFGQGNSATREYALTLDATPPKVMIKTAHPYIRRGGTGCISYTLSRDVEKTGVRVGSMFFPGFKQENGDYVCFFPFPYYMTTQEYRPQLVVTDLGGNEHVTRVPFYYLNHVFKQDTVRINDRFLETKMPEFAAQLPGTTAPLELFNKVNGELRQSNAAKLLEIGQKSAPTALWNDAFLPLPNGAVKAGFGEHRTYLYNGEKQNVEATHLGLDLASLAQSPVPAGNDGVVVFADYLGIYGNLVVIDHGLGLQSLYSHLSEISVTEGQPIARGDTLGRTGVSGMAVGDHLHFGILVSGLEVSPIEWLDRKWIRDNITDRLEEVKTPGPRLRKTEAQESAPGTKPVVAPAAKAAPKAATKPAPKNAVKPKKR